MSTAKGAHGTCSTVKIQVEPHDGNPDGLVEINEADFDETKHTLVESEVAKGKGKRKKNEE